MEKIIIDLLKLSFLKTTVSSEKLIAKIANTAKEAPESILPIEVGFLNGEYYIIDGHARVEAFKRAGLSYIQANIHELNDKEEVVVNHIRYNKHSMFNPLMLYEALKDEDEKDLYKIAKKYWLDVEEVRTILSISKLGEEAYNSLKYYIDLLCKKFDNVYIPHYIIKTLSKIPIEHQKEVVDYIFINIDRPENRFSFPEEDSILAFVSYYKSNTNKEPSLKTADKLEKKLINESKELTILKCIKCDTTYAINKKKLTVSLLESNHNLLIIKDDVAKNTYALHPDIVEEFENEGLLHLFIASNKEEAFKLISKSKSRKFLILTCENE